MNKLVKLFFTIINPLYILGSIIVTMGIEQILVYGYQTMVVYSFWMVNAWALPYTILAYGIIFLMLVHRFRTDSLYIFAIIYVIWDIPALAGFLMFTSINPFYILLMITSIPSFYVIIKKYKMVINWKIFILYFIVSPIVSRYLQVIAPPQIFSFSWESVNAFTFALFFYFGLKEHRMKYVVII